MRTSSTKHLIPSDGRRQLLENIKRILSNNNSAENQQQELLKILPQYQEFFQNSIRKIELDIAQLEIEIIKLIKPILLKSQSIFYSSQPQEQEKLTRFLHLISKRTSKQTNFQRSLAEYISLNFIGIEGCVSVEKEGIFFKKNADESYSAEPAGTADVVVKIIDKKGRVINQYTFECDGSSHLDQAKDEARNAHLGTVASLICFNFLLVLRKNFDYF